MSGQRNLRNRIQLGIPALVVVGALSLGACSAKSDNSTVGVGKASTTVAQKSTSTSTGGNKPTGAAVEPASLLPVDADAPDGYKTITPLCDATDAAANSEDATPDETYRSPIVFSTPDAWVARGLGTGGSGSVMGTDAYVEYELESGKRIKIGYEWDGHTMDGEIADENGEPWKTFDYESSVGDKTTTITYDKVATVTIKDQDVDLYYRDPAQAPDDLSKAQYKARINVVELPKSQTEPGVSDVRSFVVTIEFDPAETEVTQDVIEKIVGSYSMPTCTWDDLLKTEEVRLQMDLNGDGKVRTVADTQKEIQDQLDNLKKDKSQDSSS